MAFLKDRIKEILLRDKHLSASDLEKALGEQQRKGGELSRILIDMKLIDEDTLTSVLSQSLGIPVISITRIKIDPQVIKFIARDVALKYQIMPVSLIGQTLTLAMADPLNIFVIDNVKAVTGYTINPIIGRKAEIAGAIEQYYKKTEAPKEEASEESREESLDKISDLMGDMANAEELDEIKSDEFIGSSSGVEEIKDEAPIIRLTDSIVRQSVLMKSSDVFIEPLEKEMRVRLRVDGVIREIDRLPKAILAPLVSRIKVISNLDISEHRLPQDGRFKMIVSADKEVDFRVNVLPTALGEKVCLRVLDQTGTVLDVEKLGFEASSLRRLKECALKPHGMILTCGPTGSGKTTTLYSILKHVDSPEKNIVTVEDPVEYQFKGACQVNVKPAMGLTFATSLRSILRQDPDIIMIGEIRDAETLDIAVKAALTGHLVLSSLHTTTASGSVVRMVNMGVEPFLICSSVLAIIAQRLLRKVCQNCKEPYTPPEAVIEKVGLRQVTQDKEIILYRGKGCEQCFKSGYKGRVGITEILVMTPALKEVIMAMAGEPKVKEVSRREGMITMREDALLKALKGLTTLEEVLRITAPDEILEKK
ncbi:MAG: Flp pilus assembly complex ATPase component TadA [Candidatus Omnitrophica bacterium]|nr:Flp pilus assembly complex ATPase component TadA [Candidatus Omnitrophota bacterium]